MENIKEVLFMSICIVPHHCTQFRNSNINFNFKVIQKCAQGEPYSLESMLIEKKNGNKYTSL